METALPPSTGIPLPKVRAAAPLRLGLAGGGTDVSPYSDLFGGAVLNATINHFAFATLEPRTDGRVGFSALDLGENISFDLEDRIEGPGPLALLRGIYTRIVRDFLGGRRLPLQITTHSDAPVGSGLGSSSAMVVAVLTAFSEYLKLPLGEYDVARLAFDIERVDLAMQGGKQDQYAATFGGVNFMEFYGDRVIVNPLRIRSDTLSELQYNLLLYYLGSSRLSSAIIENQIENVKQGAQKSIEAMHQLKEQAQMQKEALLKGDLPGFGRLLGMGWDAKKRMSSQITNSAIDTIHARCMELGALGVKVSGAGGGGFMMIYCDGYKKFKVMEGLKDLPGEIIKFQFHKGGASAWRLRSE